VPTDQPWTVVENEVQKLPTEGDKKEKVEEDLVIGLPLEK